MCFFVRELQLKKNLPVAVDPDETEARTVCQQHEDKLNTDKKENYKTTLNNIAEGIKKRMKGDRESCNNKAGSKIRLFDTKTKIRIKIFFFRINRGRFR